MPRVDVDALRKANRIEDVVAASGVELRPRGRGFMACCPFHVEDRHPSMSVGGVEGHFHCFACGARGDVIDYVARYNGVDFREAADRLTAGMPFRGLTPRPRTVTKAAIEGPDVDRTAKARIFEINAMAWEFFTEGSRGYAAERYLTEVRGIDVSAIRRIESRSVAGLASASVTMLSDHLARRGVAPNELIDADLARYRFGRLCDTYRGRVVLPVRDSLDNIEGFLGRTLSVNPNVPKYRNPTTTATFEKSRSIYRPTHHKLDHDGHAIVVEGAMDALAITAVASANGLIGKFGPITTSGLSVSRVQAVKVMTLSPNSVTLAFDGDEAGRAGAGRWADMLCRQLGRDIVAVHVPDGRDPADLVASLGQDALRMFRAPSTQLSHSLTIA